jgi:hypothetical protein
MNLDFRPARFSASRISWSKHQKSTKVRLVREYMESGGMITTAIEWNRICFTGIHCPRHAQQGATNENESGRKENTDARGA